MLQERIGEVNDLFGVVNHLIKAAVQANQNNELWNKNKYRPKQANFALFVSLTPGAIGIREAFLVFSQDLHHIPNDIIVAANVLDRAVYILFLGLLFIIVLLMHAGSKLQLQKVKASLRTGNTHS